MKPSIYLLITLELSFFLTACSQNELSSVDFPATEQLFVSEMQHIDGVSMRYPFRVRRNDSCLYVMDLHAGEYYVHQFEYPSMKHRRSFAKRGKGPGELLDAENIRLNATADCWVLDANNTKLDCFQNNGDSLFQGIVLDKRLIRSLDFDLYADSLFIVPDYTGTHRFDILGPDGTIRESRGQIPLKKKDGDIPAPVYAQAWRGFLDYNPENGLLAIATQLGEVIEIYDVPGDSLVKVIYGKEGEPRFQYRGGYAVPDGIMGYSDVWIGKENIYALFWGHSFKDIRQNQSIEGGNRIQVFDLAGNPVKQYFLDRYITGFCIDEANGIITGLNVNSNQPVITFCHGRPDPPSHAYR
ncbi:hypothetical protein FACS189474_0980 [Bacteroidia bacterium]|nr:hypothetical protein FACS189474_0980 [Bacteroidia bacterium]